MCLDILSLAVEGDVSIIPVQAQLSYLCHKEGAHVFGVLKWIKHGHQPKKSFSWVNIIAMYFSLNLFINCHDCHPNHKCF